MTDERAQIEALAERASIKWADGESWLDACAEAVDEARAAGAEVTARVAMLVYLSTPIYVERSDGQHTP